MRCAVSGFLDSPDGREVLHEVGDEDRGEEDFYGDIYSIPV